MKTTNKKRGFTIVELVIVIAVIAILAAVLIPTFSGVVKNAKATAAMQDASTLYRQALTLTEDGAINGASGETTPDAYIKVGKGDDVRWFTLINGDLASADAPADNLIRNEKPNADATAQTIYLNISAADGFTVPAGESYEVYVYTVIPANQ